MTDSISRRGRLISRLLLFVPLIAFTLSVVVYFYHLGNYLNIHLAPLIAQAGSAGIKREITIGKLNIFIPGVIELDNVVVSDHATLADDAGKHLVEAQRIRVDYDWPLLFSKPTHIAQILGDVSIDGATGRVERYPANKWNFSSFIPHHPKPEGEPYTGIITVTHGTLAYIDNTAIPELRGRENIITNVGVTVDLRSLQFIRFVGTGHSPQGLFNTGKVEGDILRNFIGKVKGRGYRIHAQVTKASAPFLVDDFVPAIRPFVNVTSGLVNADVNVTQNGPVGGPLDVQGFASVANASFIDVKHQVLRQPGYGIGGTVFFTARGATVSLAGASNGVPVQVSGGAFGFPNVSLAMQINLPSLPIEGLNATLPFIPNLPPGVHVPSRGQASVSISGDIRDITAQLGISIPSVFVSGIPLIEVQAQATYSRGLVAIKAITAKQSGGAGVVSARGLVDTRTAPLALAVAGELDDIDLSRFDVPANNRTQVGSVTGSATAAFVALSGNPGEPGAQLPSLFRPATGAMAPIKMLIGYKVAGFSIHGYSIPRISGRLQYVQGVGFHIPEFDARDAFGGALLVRGDVPTTGKSPKLDLSVTAARIDIGQVSKALGYSDLRGSVYFQGQVSGTVASPSAAGHVSLVAAAYKNHAIDLASGPVEYRNGNVAFDDLSIQAEPATIHLSGYINHAMAKAPGLDLHLSVSNAELSDIISLAPPNILAQAEAGDAKRYVESATGTVDTTVDVRGTLLSPTLAGDVTVTDATVAAYEFQSVHASFAFSGQRVLIPEFDVAWEDATLDGSGSYNLKTRQVEGTFTGNNLDAQRLARLAGQSVDTTGTISVAGTAHGTLDNPAVNVQVVTDQLVVAGLTLNSVRIAAKYTDGVVSSTGVPVTVSLGAATYTVTDYRYDTKTQAIHVAASVTNERIANVLTRLEGNSYIMDRIPSAMVTRLYQLPKPLDGGIEIPSFTVDGTLAKPSLSAIVSLHALTIGTSHLNQANADLAYSGATLTIHSFIARGKVAYLEAEGSVDTAGAIDMNLEASNISLALLNPLLPDSDKLGGTIGDLTVDATGETASPEVTASLTLDNPSFNALEFDRLDSGRITIANKQITIDGLTVTKDETISPGKIVQHIASVRGSLPFGWKAVDGAPIPDFPTDVPMDLHASIPEQSLSVLSLFAPKIAPSALQGQFHASVDVGGTLADKQLTGEVAIENGIIEPPGFQTSLTNVNALVTFSGNQAQIVSATANSSVNKGKGGSLAITGLVKFSGERPPEPDVALALLGGVTLDLNVTANKFQVKEPKLVQYGNAGFSGTTTGQIHVTDGLLWPTVAGLLTIENTDITLPTGTTPVAGPAPVLVIDPAFAVKVKVARGAKIDSSQVKVTDAGGEFALAGSLDEPDLTGGLTIYKGTFNLPTARFRLVSGGVVDVAYKPTSPTDTDALRIGVNLAATTTVSISQQTLNENPNSVNTGLAVTPSLMGNFGGNDRYKITAYITGTLRSDGTGLNIKFESDPQLPQPQIIAALGGQFVRDFGTGNADSGIQTLFAQVLTNQLGNAFLEPLYDATGLDFAFDYTPGLPLVVTLTRQIGPRLDVQLTRFDTSRQAGAVASTLEPPQYELLLGYNLTNRLRASVSTDDQRDFGVELEGVFSF